MRNGLLNAPCRQHIVTHSSPAPHLDSESCFYLELWGGPSIDQPRSAATNVRPLGETHAGSSGRLARFVVLFHLPQKIVLVRVSPPGAPMPNSPSLATPEVHNRSRRVVWRMKANALRRVDATVHDNPGRGHLGVHRRKVCVFGKHEESFVQ